MKTLNQHIINFATGYKNAFNNRVTSIQSDDNTIHIRFRINANKAYQSEMVNVFANLTYNVSSNTIKVVTENSQGSRKYNSYVKYECEQLMKVFIEEAQKTLDVEIREEKRECYDRCHIALLSMIDQTNAAHKNICYGYINQILDLYQMNASVEEMENKLIEVKNEMLADTRLFPAQENVTTQTNTYTAYSRSFSTYAEAEAYCLTCDFDPSYIEAVEPSTVSNNTLELDLQLFSSSPQRKLYESNYDNVKIVTIQGEYIARIHPSEEHTNMHKICFSSDNYFYINDSEIISVEKPSGAITTNEGIIKHGIGKHLELTYTIETTKNDPILDELYYTNVHKYEYKTIQKAMEKFNIFQQQGYYNLQIVTNVMYKDSPIIEDVTECNLELCFNNEYMKELKTDNKQLYKVNEQLKQELSLYKDFIAKYKADKVFEQYINEIQSKAV